MTSGPPNGHEFNFSSSPEQWYDHIRIADEVFWPLVNHYFRDNWQRTAPIGGEMAIPKSGQYEGENLEVVISASNDLQVLGDETEPIEHKDLRSMVISSVELGIKRLADADSRDIAIGRAAEEDEDVEVDEDLVVKIGTSYTIDTDGDMVVDSYQVIEDIDGKTLWDSGASTSEEESELRPKDIIISVWPEPKIFKPDMAIIEAGLVILDSPPQILKALKDIKKNPITNVPQ